MASTMASQNRVAWTYTDDKGVHYRVSAKAVYVGGPDAAKYGGSAAAASVPLIPKGITMRKAYVVGGGAMHAIPCYETTATLWTTPGTSVTRNVLGEDTTMVSNGGILAEKRPRAGITDQS